jgi:hypothetical protein
MLKFDVWDDNREQLSSGRDNSDKVAVEQWNCKVYENLAESAWKTYHQDLQEETMVSNYSV